MNSANVILCTVITLTGLLLGYLYQLATYSVRGDFAYLGITNSQPVLVYSRADCPACQALKETLAGRGTAVRYVELDQQPTLQDLKNYHALGYQQVPLVVTKTSLTVGFHKPAILLALAGI